MTEHALQQVRDLEHLTGQLPQVDIQTQHTLHAGVYARTITIPAGVVLTGALIKVPTLLIFSGNATVYLGKDPVTLSGYHVIQAAAGRKQAFLAHTDTQLTMIFATDATSVAQAEEQFTDEADRLLSRRQLTHQGEPQCQEP